MIGAAIAILAISTLLGLAGLVMSTLALCRAASKRTPEL